ncbi:MAG: hypothetical protein AVDCRST_MAG77-2250 [uncultured Chloroflexi bacterium]|uniref:Uncharacterized protein n=1 Tax=uncultured Chloroflexota bacterium TaxID=166587 RepID=A0A6J4IGQ0_9CHLR|nr:MAG: hypothetical protein AVDCRST_MAG77-2250 [uncultured Chloroflexota bacterium]
MGIRTITAHALTIPFVSATRDIRAHHGLGHIRLGRPSIHMVETTKHWE